MNQVDYSALSQPVTNADIAAYKLRYPEAPFFESILKILSIIAVVVAVVMMMLTVAIIMTGTLQFSASDFITAIIVVIAVFAGLAAYRKSTIKRARLYKFAQANHIELLLGQPAPTDQYAGMIFDEGDSRQINEALRLPNGIEIGNYRYSTGSGRNRSETIWGYVKIGLTRRLPQMVLDAKSNNILNMSNLPDSFRGQEIKLEGDFNNYFTLYAPKEYDVDARYVFTPDVMAALIDYGSKYDMEVIDDQLYIYSKEAIRLDDTPTLQQLLQVIGIIGTEIRDQSQNYSDDRIGDRRANVIAAPGLKLKQKISIPGAVLSIVIILIYVYYLILPFFVTNNT